MSEAEIRYVVPQTARDLGDLETILTAMGKHRRHSDYFTISHHTVRGVRG
jgi:hypothetical protein